MAQAYVKVFRQHDKEKLQQEINAWQSRLHEISKKQDGTRYIERLQSESELGVTVSIWYWSENEIE